VVKVTRTRGPFGRVVVVMVDQPLAFVAALRALLAVWPP
jgi:hypothetical protein